MSSFGQWLEGGAAAVTIAGFAGVIGRASARVGRHHREEREKQIREEANRENTILELTWAIKGREATAWERARPGLREVVEQLNSSTSALSNEIVAHKREDADLFERVAKRLDDHEARITAGEDHAV